MEKHSVNRPISGSKIFSHHKPDNSLFISVEPIFVSWNVASVNTDSNNPFSQYAPDIEIKFPPILVSNNQIIITATPDLRFCIFNVHHTMRHVMKYEKLMQCFVDIN